MIFTVNDVLNAVAAQKRYKSAGPNGHGSVYKWRTATSFEFILYFLFQASMFASDIYGYNLSTFS